MAKYNDLDMSVWKEYDDICTDSLWVIDKRDNLGAHSECYHGNFIPQKSITFLGDTPKKVIDFWILLWAVEHQLLRHND